VEKFLKENNVTVTLILKEDLNVEESEEITIRRNFLSYTKKIQEINGTQFTNDDKFHAALKSLIFRSHGNKPSFRQIIAKNIRDERNRLVNTVKVLNTNATPEEYEAVYLFWLGVESDTHERKQHLRQQRKIEVNLQRRLRREYTLSQIEQSLLVLNRNISQMSEKRNAINLNEKYHEDVQHLLTVRANLNIIATQVGTHDLRLELIQESKIDLEAELAQIDTTALRRFYEEARLFLPDLQKTFDDTLAFHNSMFREKLRYIVDEVPRLEKEKRRLSDELSQGTQVEIELVKKLATTLSLDDYQKLSSELNRLFERKGQLEEQSRLWQGSLLSVREIDTELSAIDEGLASHESLIAERVVEFNKYFSEISDKLYGEQFVLSYDRGERGYELRVTGIDVNKGTGKKKVEIAAFDLAYIKFADALGIPCLHFVLQDQIENVSDNQITELFTDVVEKMNCQYVMSILRDKLPSNIEIEKYVAVSLSQDDKLFRIK